MNLQEILDDASLDLFEAVAGAVDGIAQGALKVLATQDLVDVQYEDAANMLEQAIGVGFVAAQVFLVNVCGRRPGINRQALYWQGPQLASGAYVAAMVNDAANFWKHAAEWAWDDTDGSLAIRTRNAIYAILGEDLSMTPLHDLLLLIDSSGRISSLAGYLRCWAEMVRPSAEKELLG